MKTDLTTSIIAAIVGTVAAYFVCNLLVPKIESFTLTSLSSDTDYTLTEPNVEVFNYRSVNPTVEVYVGNCTGDNCEPAIIIDEETEENQDDDDFDLDFDYLCTITKLIIFKNNGQKST